MSTVSSIIQRELDARGWTWDDLERQAMLSHETVAGIMVDSTQITPEIAGQLAAAFGTSAALWSRLGQAECRNA